MNTRTASSTLSVCERLDTISADARRQRAYMEKDARCQRTALQKDARTASIAADATRIREGHALKLRVVRHKNAAQIATHARPVEHHARKLARLHARINAEAVAIAGHYHHEYHSVCFEEHCSIEEQQRDAENDGEVSGAGVDDFKLADTMANRAARVAACAIPPALPS
jgi:hypothetical protein